MKPFTDDDLKLMKKFLRTTPPGTFETGTEANKALIARLEAAEYALMRFHIIPKKLWTAGIKEAVGAWLKVAGK